MKAGGSGQKMENDNFWDWDNGEGRRVSSVYQDEEAQMDTEQTNKIPDAEELKDETGEIEPQATQITEDEKNQTQTDFVLIDVPATEKSETQQEPQRADCQQSNYQQTDFHSMIPVQNTQQNHQERQQNSNQSKTANHSSQFSFDDICENKVSAIAAYLLGPVGIIIALLIARDSAYTAFHVRQALKLTISSVILEIAAAVFALFGLIPFMGIIFKLVLILICAAWIGVLVLRLIAVAQVCDGEAREPAIIGKLNCFQ